MGLVRRRKGRLSRPARAVHDQVVAVVAEQLGSRVGIHPLPEGPAPADAAEGGTDEHAES